MLPVCNNASTDDEDSINLLTTLLIRYPEICSVIYTGHRSRLRLRFILNRPLSKEDYQYFLTEIRNCHKSYIYYAKADEPLNFEVKYQEGPGIGVVDLVRDTTTLTRQEIDFLIKYMQERFSAQLEYDNLDLPEDDLLVQDNLINHTLERLKLKYTQYNIIAVREEGRVLVFKR
ncbi:MAG: hypothetical protein WAO24_08675 [Peptococcia bacterium]